MNSKLLIDRRALFLALDDLREARGMSWDQVAAECGVSTNTSFQPTWENGIKSLAHGTFELTDDQLFRLLQWLDADWREFVAESEISS